MKNPFSILLNLLSGKTSRSTPKPQPPREMVPLGSSSAWGPTESAPAADGGAAGLTIDLPLSSVVYLLPDHLQSRLRPTQLASQTIRIPLQEVLPQLAHGDVRIAFGQLRQAAPHLFAPEADEDATLVQLPLGEITSRCDPALMNYYQQLQAGSDPEPTTSQASQHQALAAPAPRARPNLVAASRQEVGRFAPPPFPRSDTPGSESTLAPVARRSSVPPSTGSLGPTISPLVAPGLPEAPTEPASQPEVLLVDLAPLAERWPEALRNEIEQLNLLQAQVALPKALVSAGLKQGRVAFRWDALRSWIRPAIAPAPSAEEQTELELPLQVVAPLFLAKQRELNRPRPKLQVDEAIPDVFGMARPTPGAPEEPTEAIETRSASRLNPEPASAAPGSVEARGISTPEQLVSRAVQLHGVAGALVTLPDGLLVASRFPENRNADKVAAFLPQIFSRLGQYTEQLEMGELNTLEFLVGNVPWKAFRLKEVLFVVFGRGGEVLPNSELGLLAAQLGKP
jgi:hypothetical protein